MNMAENDQENDLHALKIRLREFANARYWDQFHSSKNLTLMLTEIEWT